MGGLELLRGYVTCQTSLTAFVPSAVHFGADSRTVLFALNKWEERGKTTLSLSARYLKHLVKMKQHCVASSCVDPETPARNRALTLSKSPVQVLLKRIISVLLNRGVGGAVISSIMP